MTDRSLGEHSFSEMNGEQPFSLAHVGDILHGIWKRRWSAVTFLLIVMTIVAVHSFSATPVYRAATLLRINKDDLKVLGFQEFVSAEEPTDEMIRTEVEVMRSREVAQRVASVLNLGADPDFQAELRPGRVGAILSKMRGDSTDHLRDEQLLNERVVNRLLAMLDVSPVRGSRLVRLTVRSYSNRLAAEIANTWADMYIRQGIDHKLQASRLAGQMLGSQIDQQKRILEESEKRLHEYARQHGILSYENTHDSINQRLTEINSLLVHAEAEMIRKEIAYKSLKADPFGGEFAIDDQIVRHLREEVARLEGHYAELLNTFKPEYPECMRLRARIDTMTATIANQTARWVRAAESDYNSARMQADALKREVANLQQEAMRLQDVAIDYNTLRRDLQTSTDHYEALLARSKEALAATQIRASKVNIVEAAITPAHPHSPNKPLNLALALFVGAMAACGLCLAMEYFDNSVRTADDVENGIGMVLLGMVPEIEEDDEVGSDNRDLVSHLDAKSTISEAYRTIRTSLAFTGSSRKTCNIVISSAMPGEGKTLTAINIATVLGQAGERVLLIDADMRKPRLHRSLHIPNTQGLSAYLSGCCAAEEVIVPTCLTNVDIMVSGPTPPNPSELINSDRMTELLAWCKLHYDHVLIDTPPVMAVTDSRLAAAKADGLIHVIHAGKTEKNSARIAKRHFDSVGAHVIGAVLNNVKPDSGRSYYYHHYYHRPEEN